ncbi:MAG: repressor LexA [Oscillospiraceae bacterium]|nr:repressor LexA [Oscillospiraceae bacterium]
MQRKDQETIDRVAEYCRQYLDKKGVLPSTRHIATAMNLSKSSGHRYLVAVKEQGLLRPETDISWKGDRAEKLINDVPCGAPTYQEANIEEYVFLPDSLFGRGHKYILTAKGDSMIGAGIEEGDQLIVRKQVTANDGDIVVALLNTENTLKRLRHDADGHPYLHAENPVYPDIQIREGDSFYIQGVLTYVIKAV